MENRIQIAPGERKSLDALIRKQGYRDYKWMDPGQIVVSQWVRMKCMFGCREYGHCAACPPNTPSVAECERFFHEYGDAVILRFPQKVKKPEERFAWTRKVNLKLLKLERAVFLAGYERAFLLFMDSCCFCKECSGSREACREPRMSRPAPEAMAVDVYSTVRKFGFPISVCTDYSQEMNRYAFLMIS
jgi:predicted metal-binding protein